MSFYVDGTERTGGTEILAGSATNAALCIDNRNLHRFGIVGIGRYHEDSSRRAVAGTVATFYTVGQGNTVLLHPYGMTDTGRAFVLH